MILSDATCITAMEQAVINRRAAFQVELCVGLSVFHRAGGASIEAKRELVRIYASVGYDCLNATGIDYKTVNRRVNVTAALYQVVSVHRWVGKLDEHDALRAVYLALEPYEFHTVSDVVRFALPKPTPPAIAATRVEPHHGALMPMVNHSGQEIISGMFRRASDRHDTVTLSTQHLNLSIPVADIPQHELLEMAQKLMELARNKNGTPVLTE